MRTISLAQTAEIWRAAVVLAVALVIAFVLGGLAGYSVRATAPSTAAPSGIRLASTCPAGSHAVVYYTAHAWSCVSD